MQRLTTSTTAARLLGAAACAAALGLVAACGSGTAPAAPPAAPVTFSDTARHAAAGHGGHSGHAAGHGSTDLELYAVQTGTLGIVVTDGEGRVLYGSAGDQADPPQSRCTDACAQAWQPLTVPTGQEPQLLGVDAAVVGRLARPDGSSQLTLGGWPVYVNRSDNGQLKVAAPGLQASGWFAMTPSGEKVTLPG